MSFATGGLAGIGPGAGGTRPANLSTFSDNDTDGSSSHSRWRGHTRRNAAPLLTRRSSPSHSLKLHQLTLLIPNVGNNKTLKVCQEDLRTVRRNVYNSGVRLRGLEFPPTGETIDFFLVAEGKSDDVKAGWKWAEIVLAYTLAGPGGPRPSLIAVAGS